MHDRPALRPTGPEPLDIGNLARVPSARGAAEGCGEPLEWPDPESAADALTTENLVRCWVREQDVRAPGGGAADPGRTATGGSDTSGTVLSIPLGGAGCELRVRVRYWSLTGHHRFGAVELHRPGRAVASPSAPEIAELLTAQHRASGAPSAAAAVTAAGGDDELAARVADSVRRTAAFLTARRREPDPADPVDPFLAGEQALLLGHPLHPTPKSRQGFDAAELRAHSPELRGSFRLHWLAADRSVIRQDSALEKSAEELMAGLSGPDAAALPAGAVALPMHPRQLLEIAERPAVRALFEAGLLHDLGPAGSPWFPTSSVRTVYRPDASIMLKLSLGVRITNSRRENLRKELHRGIEVHRLLETGLAEEWRARYPRFDIVRDPAWIGVDAPAGAGASGEDPGCGLDVMIRQNPFPQAGAGWCVAGLTARRPVLEAVGPGLDEARAGTARSRLEQLVHRLAAVRGEPVAAVTRQWFRRYLAEVVAPVLWLDGAAGIALEAHQQNTLVVLDEQGWPIGGRYRDNQGYYYRESHRAELTGRLPGLSEYSDTFVPDAVADERFAYYLALNNICGLVGAIGAQRLAPEPELLADLREFLHTAAGTEPSRLPGQLLAAPRLRCKGNLLTRLNGMDELVGPVADQSVYVSVRNPIRRAEAEPASDGGEL